MSDSERTDARDWLLDCAYEVLDAGGTHSHQADRIVERLASPEARPYLYELLGLPTFGEPGYAAMQRLREPR